MKTWGKIGIAALVIAGTLAMALAPLIPMWVQTSSAQAELMGMEGIQRANFAVNMVSRGLPTVVINFDGAIAPGTSAARQKELVHAFLAVIAKYHLEAVESPTFQLPNGTALTLNVRRDGRGSDADLDSALDSVLSANAPWAELTISTKISLSLVDPLTKAQCGDPQVVPQRFTELESRIHRTDSVLVRATVASGRYLADCPDISSAHTLSHAELAGVAALPQWHRQYQARITTYSADFDSGGVLTVTLTTPQMDDAVANTLIARLAEAGVPVNLTSQRSWDNGQHEYVLATSR